jgi:nucleotide-binding universal stress UspA family protein
METMVTRFNSYLETVDVELRGRGIKAKSDVAFGIPAESIINTADSIQADLVAMATHGLTGVGRWALGSTTDKVLQAGNTPLLLVRSH